MAFWHNDEETRLNQPENFGKIIDKKVEYFINLANFPLLHNNKSHIIMKFHFLITALQANGWKPETTI